MAKQFDAIVVGTGQSGPSLARRLAKAGRRVAIVERARFGGTCVNYGCIPTKSLVASAHAAHIARRAADFGVVVQGGVTMDMKAVKARKDGIVAASNSGVERSLREAEGVTVVTGHARFVAPKRIEVGGDALENQILEAEQIFINVGGRASVPSLPGIESVPYLTNAGMLELDTLPEHLVILGGSYIGLEFGQMYRRFGSRVTIIEGGPEIIGREDADIARAIRGILEDEGIRIVTDAKVQRVERRGAGVAVAIEAPGAAAEIEGSHLLIATGRRPNTDDLGLEAAGVTLDARGYIAVDGQLRTNVPGIFAIGDCNGRGAFTHTSYNDYEIVAANLLDGASRSVDDRITAYGLFIDPPLGRIGITEADARKKGIKALVATMPMADVGRAFERSETKGFMKIVVHADTKRILGAALLGISGDEVVQGLLDLMYADAPYTVFQRAVHIHPTVFEMIPVMLEDLKPLD